MYGEPPQGHLQGQSRDNENTRISQFSSIIWMCYNIIFVVLSNLVLKESLCFIILHTKIEFIRGQSYHQSINV